MLTTKKEKETTERLIVPNQESIKKHGEKENCIYVGILEAEMKEKVKKEYLRSIYLPVPPQVQDLT